jgi:hypothetical protein
VSQLPNNGPSLNRARDDAASAGRQQFLHACVIAGVVCALWYVIVRPLEQRLVANKASLEGISTQLATFQDSIKDEPAMAPVIADYSTRTTILKDWTDRSGNAGRLYEEFRSIAADHNVRIERIEPNTGRSAGRWTKPGDKNQMVSEVFGYSLEVTGRYEDVARFLDACENQLGASKVVGFRMTPEFNAAASAGATAGKNISATIETAHLKIDLPQSSAEKAAKKTGG